MKRSGTKAKYSPMQQANVYMVQFAAMSQDLLTNWSVAQIKDSKLYEGSKPASGSPNDLKLGVSSQDQKCETCGETKECQGHFGHIKLAEPVLHYGFLKYVQKILRCICHKCCKLKTPAIRTEPFKKKWRYVDQIQNPTKRLNQITKMLQNISECKAPEQKILGEKKNQEYCNTKIPINISLRNYKLYVSDPEQPKKSRILERHQIKRILTQLSQQEETCKKLGFEISKPIDLIIQTLAVPPPQIRPSIEMNPQKKAEDDITTAYVRILNINNQLNNNKSGQNFDRQDKIDELQRAIASIMVKLNRAKLEKVNLLGGKKKNLKTCKSISDRIKGKEGRFRQNLMGKRVDFSARSVISGDSNLTLDQLGVPEKVAFKLTVPEEVTKWNYERIVNLCKQGKVQILLKPPQDRLKDSEKPINASKIDQKQIEKYINYGIIAERSLQNGDFVLFNRQPTLHRMSMMGHRVKILPYNTFRLNLSVCTPYNADFDGDEMNMHVPQSFETISELKNIAHVPRQIIAPKNNAPVIGMVQDALLGVYLFTMRDTFLTREQIMNLAIWIEGKENLGSTEDLLPGELPIPAILKPEPLWTGKQVMSMIIPKKITIQIKKGDPTYVKDVSMIIKKGEVITGALQKEIVGSGAGGIVHSIWLQISSQATNQFISVAQRIVNNWLISSSFTVSASDVVPSEKFLQYIKEDEQKIKKLYYDVFNSYRDIKEIEKNNLHQRGKRVLDSFEFNINERLNNRLTVAQNALSKFVSPYTNNILKMVSAKSKGSQTNLAQILYLVGNQNVDGKRCPQGFSHRTLPHFMKDDNSPQSRGFVFSSFYQGLKPHEFYFHSMGGREGLSDTAVKTSRTGYIQRRLVKSLEDVIVKYDGTVRDSKNNFLQKMYGEDGFISEYIEKHRFTGAQLSEKDFQKNYKWSDNDLIQKFKYTSEQALKLNEEYERLLYARRRTREIFVIGRDTASIEYFCPIKVERLVNKIKVSNYSSDKEPVDPYFAYTEVEKLIDRCVPAPYKRRFDELQQKLRGIIGTAKKAEEKRLNLVRQFQQDSGIEIFRIHIQHSLASKKLHDVMKITKSAFTRLIEEIEYKFHQSLAPAGQCIGAIAAQSIGEPTTQMTLNTFHLAGVSDKNVTLGVPRLQQLLDSSKNIKTPNMTVFLKNKICYKDVAKNQQIILQMIMQVLPERHVKNYIQATRLYYDYNYMESKAGFGYKTHLSDKRLPLVLNIEFNLKKVISRSMWNEILSVLEKKLQNKFEVNQHVEFQQTSTTNPQLILRLLETGAINNLKGKENNSLHENIFTYVSKMEQQIKGFSVGGIPGIKNVKTSKKLVMNPPQSSKTNLDKQQKQQYEVVVFETDGSNLKACLSLSQIDSSKTLSNDMSEIYSVLGVQAARQCFINQFKQILKPYGIYVNYRHLSILTDWISMRGFITPVNRNGINRVKDVSVLRKASYEETADILFGAAAFGEKDYLKGVSQKIIFGQAVEAGTSSFKIIIDTDEVDKYKAKAGIDKNQISGEQGGHDMLSERSNSSEIIRMGFGSSTPTMNTPNPYYQGGQSVLRSMRSPGGWGQQAFTPNRDLLTFTPNRTFQQSMSPNIMTPISTNHFGNAPPTAQTPYYAPQNANYNTMSSPSIGGSSYQRVGHTPNYFNYGNSSNSPVYSGMRSSQSPSYSPASSNSSPIYSNRGDSSRQQNEYVKENQDEEDHEEPDEYEF